jgi:MFS family permease
MFLTKAISGLKKDFLSIPFGIKLLVLVIFLRSFGWGFADPFYSLYLNKFSNDYTVIGIFSSILSLSAFLTLIPLTRVLDKVKEKTIIADGESLYLFVLIAYVFAGIFKNIPLLILTILLSGVAQTLVVIGTEAYIRKHDGDGKSTSFGFYIALDYFGWIIGMIIAAYAIKYYDFNLMFLFIIPSVILSFFILPRLHENGIRSLIIGVRRYFSSKNDVVGILQDCKKISPKMIFFLIIAFFDGVIRMFSFVFIPLFALSINLSLKSIALLMAVMYFPFILSFFFSEISDRFKRMNVIAIGLLIGAISFILLYFIVSAVWIVILAAAISLAMAIVRPAYNGAITRLTPRRMMGEVTGFNNLAERMGRIVGPILTGVVADVYGLQITFLLMAVIALGLGVMTFALRGYDLILRPAECGQIAD